MNPPSRCTRRRTVCGALIVLAAVMLAGCATAPGERHPQDPLERINRGTYKFNSALDRAVLKPVAIAYRDYVPQPVRRGVGNFIDNLGYPTVIVNDFLQGKFLDGVRDTGRLVLNSTLGLGGLLDPATAIGLEKNDEDFGQTLGKWGVPAGAYLVIPLLGPSTLRDTPTRYVDARTSIPELLDDEVSAFDETGFQVGLVTLAVVNARADLLSLDSMLARAFDEYAVVRDSWLKRREYQVRDGDVPDEEPIEEFPMDEEEDAAPSSEPPPAAAPDGPDDDRAQPGDEAQEKTSDPATPGDAAPDAEARPPPQ